MISLCASNHLCRCCLRLFGEVVEGRLPKGALAYNTFTWVEGKLKDKMKRVWYPNCWIKIHHHFHYLCIGECEGSDPKNGWIIMI